jgi:hypothetical protein
VLVALPAASCAPTTARAMEVEAPSRLIAENWRSSIALTLVAVRNACNVRRQKERAGAGEGQRGHHEVIGYSVVADLRRACGEGQ